MDTYATAQNIGLRSHQCDATAVHTSPGGIRAYALLDGIGSTDTISAWTRNTARRVARAAAQRGSAEAGLRAVYDRYAAIPARNDPFTRYDLPAAAVVVAVTVPGKPITIAWCGDSRAYVIVGNHPAVKITQDHNLRRVRPPRGNRNIITSYLGAAETDAECVNTFGHPAIEAFTIPLEPLRLVLASDGAYEPYEDGGRPLAAELAGPTDAAAHRFVDGAVRISAEAGPGRPSADNATVLIADIQAST